MKTFTLNCPHCRKAYNLGAGESATWWDDHVTRCRALVHHQTLTVATFFAAVRARLHQQALDRVRMIGTVLLQLRDGAGEIKLVQCGGNLIVNAGKDWAIDRMQSGSPPAVAGYQAIGTGATAAAAGDTALQTEIARQAGDTHTQPVSTTDRLVTTFAAGTGTGAITETGRLNAASTGTLVARQVFSVVNKGAGDSFQVTHDITVS